MIETKILPTHGCQDEAYKWAVKHGRWIELRGYKVLQLGLADYVIHQGILHSVNSDPGDTDVPFGIRWVVFDPDNQYGAWYDKLAVEQFRKAGFEVKAWVW